MDERYHTKIWTTSRTWKLTSFLCRDCSIWWIVNNQMKSASFTRHREYFHHSASSTDFDELNIHQNPHSMQTIEFSLKKFSIQREILWTNTFKSFCIVSSLKAVSLDCSAQNGCQKSLSHLPSKSWLKCGTSSNISGDVYETVDLQEHQRRHHHLNDTFGNFLIHSYNKMLAHSVHIAPHGKSEVFCMLTKFSTTLFYFCGLQTWRPSESFFSPSLQNIKSLNVIRRILLGIDHKFP